MKMTKRLLNLDKDELRNDTRKRARLLYESRPLVDLDETFDRVDVKSIPSCPKIDDFDFEISDKKYAGRGGSGRMYIG